MLTEAVRMDLPQILAPVPGPRAKALIARDERVLSPSYTRCYPLVVRRRFRRNRRA
jgi:4-aminobutyrate aminotransferase